MGNELAFTVSLLYWALLYSGEALDGVNANTHLINAIIALADFWICGIPIYALQVIYAVSFGAAYSIFTGLYFVGSDGIIVYSVLNYRENLGFAVVIILLTVFVVIPAVHFIIFYSQSKLKEVILYCIFKERREAMINENEVMEQREDTL